ncbi:hypothetical protein FRC01_009268 [Tulasnella sp. 417]|nr:hypothetical protein FRC01_009268 [Tulasnella sp. 417]
MRIRKRVLETQNRTFTAIPKTAGRILFEFDVAAALHPKRVVILSDQENGNQWVSFSEADNALIDEAMISLKLEDWVWRKVGTDVADPEELGRFQVALLESGEKSSQGSSELPHNAEDAATADDYDTEWGTPNTSDQPELHSKPFPHSPPEITGQSTSAEAVNLHPPPPTDTGLQPNLASIGLPLEIYTMIFESILAPLSHKFLEYNVQLEKIRQVCKHWRNISIKHRASGFGLHRNGIPFSIKFATRPCDSDVTEAKLLRKFSEFMKVVKPYRAQWKSLDITLPQSGWTRLEPYIKPHPAILKTLVLSFTRGGEQQDHFGNDQNYPKISLLDGNRAKLERLVLKDIPIHYNPTVFPNILELHLSGGICVSTHELTAFLTNALRLEIFELSDIRTSGGPFASSWVNSISLPSLRWLTLQELANPVNAFALLLTLHAPGCRRLSLSLAMDQDTFPDDPNTSLDHLETRLVAITFALAQSKTKAISHIRLGNESEGHTWWNEGVDNNGQLVGVRITLRFANDDDIDPETDDMTTVFCGFVKNILERAELTPDIKVDAMDMLRPIGPILQRDVFEGLNLVGLSVNIVDGYLGRLADFITGKNFNSKYRSLRTLHLIITELKHEEEKLGSKRQNVEDFIERLLQSGHAATDEQNLCITLHGRFVFTATLWEALKDKGQFKGIALDHSRARLWNEDGRILYLKEGSAVGVQEVQSCIDRPW